MYIILHVFTGLEIVVEVGVKAVSHTEKPCEFSRIRGFLSQAVDDDEKIPMPAVSPFSAYGDGFQVVRYCTPCLFGGLQVVTVGDLLIGLAYEAVAYLAVVVCGIAGIGHWDCFLRDWSFGDYTHGGWSVIVEWRNANQEMCARMCGREGWLSSGGAGKSMQIYTIGHSNHSWETFSGLLVQNEIELLVDTRSKPVSRFAPFANARLMPALLEEVGIDYEFMGGVLGGKPADSRFYDVKGKPDYHRMRELDEFQEAIGQLASMASRRQTAILCSEEDPSHCHRLLLLGPSLEENGCELLHVRGGGQVQTTGQLAVGKKYGEQLQGAFRI